MPIIDSQVHAYEANTPKRPCATKPNWPPHVTGDEMVAAMDKVDTGSPRRTSGSNQPKAAAGELDVPSARRTSIRRPRCRASGCAACTGHDATEALQAVAVLVTFPVRNSRSRSATSAITPWRDWGSRLM